MKAILQKSYQFKLGTGIGFDCAHYGDLAPFYKEKLAALGFDFGHSYEEIWRDPDFVETNCKQIIDQLENGVN